jgi:hypothetical protein
LSISQMLDQYSNLVSCCANSFRRFTRFCPYCLPDKRSCEEIRPVTCRSLVRRSRASWNPRISVACPLFKPGARSGPRFRGGDDWRGLASLMLIIIAQAGRAILLANATAATFFGLRASNPRSHGAALPFLMACWMTRGGAQHQQLAQALVTGAADLAARLPAGSRVLARRDPDPHGKVPARAEHLRVRHFEREAQPADRADPGDRRQQLARSVVGRRETERGSRRRK